MGKFFSLLGAFALVFWTGCSSDHPPEESREAQLSGLAQQTPVVTIEARFLQVEDNFLQNIGVDFRGVADTQPGSIAFGGSSLNGPIVVNSNLVGGAENNEIYVPPYGSVNRLNPIVNGLGGATGFTGMPLGDTFFDERDILARVENIFDLTTLDPDPFTNAGGLSLGYEILDDAQVSLILQAVQQNQNRDIISAPRIITFDRQNAVITSGHQFVPYVELEHRFEQRLRQLNGGGGGFSSNNQERFADTGFTLDLTPHIRPNNMIDILFRPGSQLVTDFFETTVNGNPVQIQLPVLAQSPVTTTIAVPDGETILLGGMRMRNETQMQNGVPILSKIPVLKRFFQHESYQKDERVLLILVRPQIVIQSE